MSTEAVGQPITVVSPRTGEVLSLDSPTEDLGTYLADVREFESLLKEAKGVVGRELLERMRKQACWTIHAGGLKLSAPASDTEEQFDGAALREALLELVDRGELAIEAVDAAVEVVTDYKVKRAGVNALRKRDDTRTIVDAYATEVPKQRYVKVERA